jgi:hypothetical protein
MASNATIPKSARIALNPEHLVAELDGDLVIMSIETGTYYGLDPVGACVWKLVERPRTFAAVVEGVLERFEVPPEVAEQDLTAFLHEMQAEGIVSITTADG